MCTTKKEVKVFQNSNSTDAVTLCAGHNIYIRMYLESTSNVPRDAMNQWQDFSFSSVITLVSEVPPYIGANDQNVYISREKTQ